MERFLAQHETFGLEPWSEDLARIVAERRTFLGSAKGNFFKFRKVVENLPDLVPSAVDLDSKAVTVGRQSDLSGDTGKTLMDSLKNLRPWRKGPFNLFGIDVDTEWQSWMKWDRLAAHLPRLDGRRILDIGSSNGYYMFRMAEASPLFVLGLEPQSSFYYQYLAVQKYLNQANVFCLPIPYNRLPPMTGCFDLVFCMGILYHRKSPVEMLRQIHDSLAPKGTIVLENLVIEGRNNLCLFPHDRYGKMRNVFFIPDLAAMESWLFRAGFREIDCVDISPTRVEEQRKTDWILTESLEDFLDPEDPEKTVEGYPAPVRAVYLARA